MQHTTTPVTITITCTPTATGATLRWDADVLGTRQSSFVPPYQGGDLPLMLRALDVLQDPYYPNAWTAMQHQTFAFTPDEQGFLGRLGLWERANRVPTSAPRQIGQTLYRALTADPAAAQALATARDHASALGAPFALRLRFAPHAVNLAALPWELLWAPDEDLPLLFGRGATADCSRHLDLAQPLPPSRRTDGPLRVVAVAPHAGITPELRQMERAARASAWEPLLASGAATLTEISPATPEALTAALRGEPADIIHFYGHGRYHNNEGALLLDSADHSGRWVPASQIAVLFGGVGMVALNACQGGSAHGATGLLSGVAPALSAAGVPVVLAMQATVRALAASRISSAVYHALAEGSSVQAALAQARRAAYVEEPDQVSWFVPVLYVRSRDTGPVLLRRTAAPQPIELVLGAAQQAATGAVQQVVARGRGVVRSLWSWGGRGARQHISASEHGAIDGAALYAELASDQRIEASDGGLVQRVLLRDR